MTRGAHGTVSLTAAVGLLDASLRSSIDPAKTRGTVPVVWKVTDGTLEIRVPMSAIVRPLVQRGLLTARDLQAPGYLSDGEMVAALDDVLVVVRLTPYPGTEILRIYAPADEDQMTEAQLKAGRC